MLESHKSKDLTKNEVQGKYEAFKTLNQILVQANSEFMNSLSRMLSEKQVQHDQLKEKLENSTATEDDNAEYLFLGGYVQCLKDILLAKKAN